jgi:hypothetical protein
MTEKVLNTQRDYVFSKQYTAESRLSDLRLSDVNIRHAIHITCCVRMPNRNLHFVEKPQGGGGGFPKPIPAIPRVTYKKQNMWVDSDIFGAQIFDDFPHYPGFSIIQPLYLYSII